MGFFRYYLAFVDTYFEAWTERYVLFDGSCLKIMDLANLGHFPLVGTHVENNSNDSKIFHLIHDDGRTLSLMTDTEELCERWKYSLSEMCNQTGIVTTEDQKLLHFYNTLHEVMKKPCPPIPPINSCSSLVDGNGQEKFFILSLDGGGTRGIICCVILERILEKFPSFLSHVKLVAGTSNGSMIAAALATGHHPKKVREMLELTAHSIFSEQQTRYSLSSAKWSNRFLNLLCQDVWKERVMESANVQLLIPSFLLDNKNENLKKRTMECKTFTSFGYGKDVKISDAVLRSCSAPTFFSSWQDHIDGGVYCHNPSDVAVTQAIAHLKVNLSDIYVLSLSTGHVNHYLPSGNDNPTTFVDESNPTHNWGLLYWAPHLSTVSFYVSQ